MKHQYQQSTVKEYLDSLKDTDKKEIMIALLNQMHLNRKDSEVLENRTAFAVITILFILAAYIIKGDYQLTEPFRLGVILFSLILTSSAIWFLCKLGQRIRTECRMIVRIEQALGLYDSERYISQSKVERLENNPFKEATIFPLEAQKWGKGDWQLMLTPHIVGVILAGLVAISVVWLDTRPSAESQQAVINKQKTIFTSTTKK